MKRNSNQHSGSSKHTSSLDASLCWPPRPLSDAVAPNGYTSERGSVLVFIIGVLALMALIVIAYATIGVGDRRTSAAATEASKIDDRGGEIASYFAQVVGDSSLAVTRQRVVSRKDASYTTVNSGPLKDFNDRVYRKSWTIAGIDPELRSSPRQADDEPRVIGNPAAAWRKFDPTGSIVTPWPLQSEESNRRAPSRADHATGLNVYASAGANGLYNERTDPRIGADPYLSSIEPTWINKAGTLPEDAVLTALDRQDWLNMSNFAPDGRAVNLASLRGNFGAESGFDYSSTVPIVPLQTSGFLSLLEFDPGNGTQRLERVQTSNWRTTLKVPTKRADPTDDQTALFGNRNKPSDWFTNQVGAFRPVGDDRFAPGDVRNLDNQLADADGDGMYDARWTELINISDPANPRPILTGLGDLRLFVAAKAIDLSGLINVNTALAFNEAPNYLYPAGTTPADIDLRRVLTMRDAYGAFTTVTPLHTDAFQPNDSTLPSFYGRGGSRQGYDAFANEVGDSAFSALFTSKNTGYSPTTQGNGRFFAPVPALLTSAAARSALYTQGSRDGSGLLFRQTAIGAGAPTISGEAISVFGLADEAELRAFNGLNDPGAISRLEAVLDGRSSARIGETPDYGPMRSNRPLSVERSPSRTWEQALYQNASSVRNLITTISSQRPISAHPARPLMEVVSVDALTAGAASLEQAIPGLSASEMRTDIRGLVSSLDVWPTTATQQAIRTDLPPGTPRYNRDQSIAVATLFRGFAESLAPDLMLAPYSSAWTNPTATPAARRTARDQEQARMKAFWEPSIYNRGDNVKMLSLGDRPMFDGVRAETALRVAAHMTANFLDMEDRSDRPSMFTLVLSNEMRTNATLQESFPFFIPDAAAPDAWVRRGLDVSGGQPVSQPRLIGVFDPDIELPGDRPVSILTAPGFNATNDLLPSRLPDDSRAGASLPAVTIYGIKPQPFITMIAAVSVYSDVPDAVSGSTNDGTSSGSPPDERFDRPNINGSKVNTNADFLCEIVSIQLSNPFDRPISLSLPSNVPPLAENASDADRAAWQLQYGAITANETRITDLRALQYYIEFAGRYFAVADADFRNPGPGELKSVVLEPGASRNFLILADTPANLLARFRKVQRAAVPPLTQDEFFNWLDRQFDSAGMADPVVLRQIDPQTMALGSAFALDSPSPTNVATVSLLAAEANFTPAPTNKQVKLWRAQRFGTEVTGPNLLGNDQLVDRLRDPSSTVNSLEIGFRPAVTAIDSTAGGLETDLTGNHDNKGLTAALWSVIRRPRWSSTTGEAIGNLPLWTMESKNLAPTNAENPTKAYNEADRFPSGSGTTVTATKSHFVSTFASFIGSTGPSGATPCLAAALPASAQIGNAIPGTDLNFSRLAIANLEQLQLRVAPGSPSPVQHPMPLRTADILMAWAIGPFDAPLRVNGDPETEQDTRYTTLSEAIAVALDVDTPTEPTDAFYRLGARSKFAPSEPQYTTTSDGILDGGFLRLDVGVPYNDLDANGRFGQTGRVLPVNPGSTDAIPDPQRGLGVPFAFNILERFRTDRFGTIYSGYQGRVNINTAPRAVLSALPMVTPDGDSGAWVRGGGTNAVYQPSTETYDVAAALIAYRDKQLVYTRSIGGSTTRGTPIDMSDDNKDEIAINRQRADGQYFQIGRRNATGIDALRETPGFQTPGEVLAARIGQTFRDATKRINVTNSDDLVRSGIDRLGRDDRALPPRVGATSSVYVSGTNIDANDAKDSYEQRLAIANAVLGTTTLRSDTFCVWFVVEGFRPSDVQGLQSFVPAPEQVAFFNDPLFTVPEYSTPMTPSFKRRYMMVLDRSNVTKQGDKPKILLLQEVPL